MKIFVALTRQLSSDSRFNRSQPRLLMMKFLENWHFFSLKVIMCFTQKRKKFVRDLFSAKTEAQNMFSLHSFDVAIKLKYHTRQKAWIRLKSTEQNGKRNERRENVAQICCLCFNVSSLWTLWNWLKHSKYFVCFSRYTSKRIKIYTSLARWWS